MEIKFNILLIIAIIGESISEEIMIAMSIKYKIPSSQTLVNALCALCPGIFLTKQIELNKQYIFLITESEKLGCLQKNKALIFKLFPTITNIEVNQRITTAIQFIKQQYTTQNLAFDSQTHRRNLGNYEINTKSLNNSQITDGKGENIKIGIIDSGIAENIAKLLPIEDIINLSSDNSTNDDYCHGTGIASIFGSQKKQCEGIAKEASLYIIKIFNSLGETSIISLLEALNYAQINALDIINLSGGGIIYSSPLLRQKIAELTAAGTIIVSAAGNDGPYFGTINSPGNIGEVISVGSISESGGISTFSSRGFVLDNLISGIGDFKPDLVALGESMKALNREGKCTRITGTSVSAALVSAAFALILSNLPSYSSSRINYLMWRAIWNSSIQMKGTSILEQGSGEFNPEKAYKIMANWLKEEDLLPKFEINPKVLNLSNNNSYFSPLSREPFYATKLPMTYTLKIISLYPSEATYISPVIEISNNGGIKECLNLTTKDLSLSQTISAFPFIINTVDSPICQNIQFLAHKITLNFTINTNGVDNTSFVTMDLILDFIPTPYRSKRVLFDQYHNIIHNYEGINVLGDDLGYGRKFDVYGDSIYTNFNELGAHLRDSGYYIEILFESFLCFDPMNYAAIMIIDPEQQFHLQEILKLRTDIEEFGLSIILVADWYNSQFKEYYNSRTQQTTNYILGSNIPGINELLEPYHIAFGEEIYSGNYFISRKKIGMRWGSEIVKFPRGGYLLTGQFTSEIGRDSGSISRDICHAGLIPKLEGKEESGQIFIMSDSGCLDSSSLSMDCIWLIPLLLSQFEFNRIDENIFGARNLLELDFISLRYNNSGSGEIAVAIEWMVSRECIERAEYPTINVERYKHIPSDISIHTWKQHSTSQQEVDEFWISTQSWVIQHTITITIALFFFLAISIILYVILRRRKRELKRLRLQSLRIQYKVILNIPNDEETPLDPTHLP